VATLAWPSQSPDLNAIEQLWAVLKRCVGAQPAPATVEQLWERVEREWWSTDPALCRRLVESMPHRIEGVIKAPVVVYDPSRRGSCDNDVYACIDGLFDALSRKLCLLTKTFYSEYLASRRSK